MVAAVPGPICREGALARSGIPARNHRRGRPGPMSYPQRIGQAARGLLNLGTERSSMSFRGRLLLFFVIIVVVPMVAVALVLFSLTADSENGKADAAIAQGLRSAASSYESDRQSARRELSDLAGDATLGAAVKSGRPPAIAKRLQRLIRSHSQIRAMQVYGPGRVPLATAGSRDAIAFAAAAPSTRGGRSLGLVL